MASPSITTVTKRYARTGPMAIQQSLAAAKHFTGALPQAGAVRADSPLTDGATYKYAQLAADGGGLFFWNSYEPLICTDIFIDLGAAGDISVFRVALDPTKLEDDQPGLLAGDSILIAAVTATRYLALDETKFKGVLLPYHGIQIVTTNSGAAQIASVTAYLERTFVR